MRFPPCTPACLLGIDDRSFGWLLALVSAGLLGSVYILQYGFGYQPCDMCLLQRYPVLLTLGLGLLGGLWRHPLTGIPLRLLALLAFVTGAGLAFYHSGIEAGWWQGMTECSGGFSGAATTEELYRQIMAAPTVRCDDVQLRILGLTLAGWNVIVSGAIAVAIGLTLAYRRPYADE